MTIEQLIIALAAYARQREDIFPTREWARRFLESVNGHLMVGSGVSTEQARIFVRIASHHVDALAASLKANPDRIRAALAAPTFHTPPHVSADIPREIIRAGLRQLAFRFKRNSSLLTQAESLFYFYHHDVAARTYDSDHKVHFVDVDSTNVDQIINLALEWDFEVDDGALTEIEDVLRSNSMARVSADTQGLVLDAPSDRRLWLALAPYVTERLGEARYRLQADPGLIRALLRVSTLPLTLDGICEPPSPDYAIADPQIAAAAARLHDQGLRGLVMTHDLSRAAQAILPVAQRLEMPLMTVVAPNSAIAAWCAIAEAHGHSPVIGFDDNAPFVIIAQEEQSRTRAGPPVHRRRAGALIFQSDLVRADGMPGGSIASYPQMTQAGIDFESCVIVAMSLHPQDAPGTWDGPIIPLCRHLGALVGPRGITINGMGGHAIERTVGRMFSPAFADYARFYGLVDDLL